jgi:hypothetical protein
MINIAMLTKTGGAGIRGHFLVSSQFATPAVVGITQTMMPVAARAAVSVLR